MTTVLPFTEDVIKEYLDQCIRFWMGRFRKENGPAIYYIDAYESTRISIFGKTLKEEEEEREEGMSENTLDKPENLDEGGC